MNLKYIFKIIDIDEWQKVKDSGAYSGSLKDIKDGFIHFSGEDQVRGTLEKHYSKHRAVCQIRTTDVSLQISMNFTVYRN